MSATINEIGNVYDRLKVIERAGSNAQGRALWKCQCECENIIIVRGADLRNGHTKSCGCSTESFGSQKIKQLLKDNNIKFISEYTFSDFKSDQGVPYRFDFAIFKDKELYEIIEFDGAQHFSPQKGYYEGQFEKIQLYDKIKNDYCKQKNIKLIRVPYTEEDNIDLKMLELENYYKQE